MNLREKRAGNSIQSEHGIMSKYNHLKYSEGHKIKNYIFFSFFFYLHFDGFRTSAKLKSSLAAVHLIPFKNLHISHTLSMFFTWKLN